MTERWVIDDIYLCWLWTGQRNAQGYGTIYRDGTKLAHREVYAYEVGPIPAGLALDHRCRRRHCVNPLHLEPVKQSVNERRKFWRNRVKEKKCQFGHSKFEHGRRTPEGGSICLICG